jgi:3'-phosphoadenosine 5'-phosphosulfate sulfotransferase (PAPS reductase)/FAD synthetase
MDATSYHDIKSSLRQLYLDDPRPWLVGFSGGKDSTMLASLIVEVVAGIPDDQRKKPVAVLSTDTRVEIPAIVEMVESTLARMQKFSQQNNLNLEANLLKPPPEQSFWVNIIGRGYPPPNRTFRWCTQRLKIDPVTAFVNQRMGHWGEAILHLGARRAESATRAQTMANRSSRNGLNRHPDLPRVWVSNQPHRIPHHRRGLGLPPPKTQSVGRRQPPPLQTLRQRLQRRMSHPDRHQHPELRQFSLRLLDLHGRGPRQGQRGTARRRR